MLRIGIDGRALQGNRAGIGRYVFDLCRELDSLLPAAIFFVYSNIPLNLPVSSRRWILRTDPIAGMRKLKPIFWFKLRCGSLCKKDNLDVFWGAATFLPQLPHWVRTVSTVFDLNHLIVPDTMPTKLCLTYRLFFAKDVARANKVAVISRGTCDRLAFFTGRIADNIITPSVDKIFQPQSQEKIAATLTQYGISQPYILAVGTWEPRKNLELLIKVFTDLRRRNLLGSLRLLLVGGRGWKDSRVARLLAEAEEVVALGYVSDDSLSALYSGAQMFVFPSLYEGFGMPVLEARHCGTPVVTTDIPELREAGGDEAIYIQPTKMGIERGILQALSSQRKTTGSICHPSLRESAEKMAALFLSM